MTDRIPASGGGHVVIHNIEDVIAGRPAAPTTAQDAGPSIPYRVTIKERDAPYHGVTVAMHDKPPAPTEGGGGYEEVAMPQRGAVSIWRGRGLMKMGFSVIFDQYQSGQDVIDSAFKTLLALWRPEDDTKPPPPIRLAALGSILPYSALTWTLSSIEWAEAQGNPAGERTQQSLMLTFTEYRSDERLRSTSTKHNKKQKAKTKRYEWKKGDTLASVAEKHHTTAAKLGAMQKPPVKDGRGYHPGHKIIVPA